MAKSTGFHLGVKFPHEGFVQASVETYFARLGYSREAGSHADLVCVQPQTGERWLVEAKRVTSDVGLDFRTGLGQLAQRMADPDTKYALAVPDVRAFIAQCRQVSSWLRQALHLHWIIVTSEGSVRLVAPNQEL